MIRFLVVATVAFLSRAAADMVEPATKISFGSTFQGTTLAGVGVRVKKIGPVAAKVYGLGCYVDEKGAKVSLAKYKGAQNLEKNDGFFRDLMAGNFDKAFVLKMARSVGTEKMVSALAESVKPRLSGSPAPLATFEQILLKAVGAEGGANKGMQFGFVCKPGSLCVSINGKAAGTVSSKPLSAAMQDVYLGKNAVSPDAKKSAAAGIVKMLG